MVARALSLVSYGELKHGLTVMEAQVGYAMTCISEATAFAVGTTCVHVPFCVNVSISQFVQHWPRGFC
jgi:hypothetical protein